MNYYFFFFFDEVVFFQFVEEFFDGFLGVLFVFGVRIDDFFRGEEQYNSFRFFDVVYDVWELFGFVFIVWQDQSNGIEVEFYIDVIVEYYVLDVYLGFFGEFGIDFFQYFYEFIYGFFDVVNIFCVSYNEFF